MSATATVIWCCFEGVLLFLTCRVSRFTELPLLQFRTVHRPCVDEMTLAPTPRCHSFCGLWFCWGAIPCITLPIVCNHLSDLSGCTMTTGLTSMTTAGPCSAWCDLQRLPATGMRAVAYRLLQMRSGSRLYVPQGLRPSLCPQQFDNHQSITSTLKSRSQAASLWCLLQHGVLQLSFGQDRYIPACSLIPVWLACRCTSTRAPARCVQWTLRTRLLGAGSGAGD